MDGVLIAHVGCEAEESVPSKVLGWRLKPVVIDNSSDGLRGHVSMKDSGWCTEEVLSRRPFNACVLPFRSSAKLVPRIVDGARSLNHVSP
jgi:hypothetical protein